MLLVMRRAVIITFMLDLLQLIVIILAIACILLVGTWVIDFKFVPCINSFSIFIVMQKKLLLVGLIVIAPRGYLRDVV